MKSLVWLRAYLRVEDNPVLKEACKRHEEVSMVVYDISSKTSATIELE